VTIADHEQGGKKIDVAMSLTAPGCGMSDVLKADVEKKLARLPEVKGSAGAGGLSIRRGVREECPEAAKLQLGFDLDYGGPQSAFPILR